MIRPRLITVPKLNQGSPLKRALVLPTRLVILVAILICASDLHSAASARAPSAPSPAGQPLPLPSSVTTTDEGLVDIRSAIRLPLNASPPIDCSVKTRGTLALEGDAHLCLCDGAAWKLVNTDKSCAWKAAP